MDQIETFRGFVVPEIRLTAEIFCEAANNQHICRGIKCSECIFDGSLETLEPFNEWMETRKK